MVRNIIPALLTDTQRNGVQQPTITQKTRNGDSVLTRKVDGHDGIPLKVKHLCTKLLQLDFRQFCFGTKSKSIF